MRERGHRDGAPAADAPRGSLWLPLLRRLTALSPYVLVWKNASPALEGYGDLDLIAPPSEWKEIEREFRMWASAEGLDSVAVCRHRPGSIFLLAVDPERSAFFELDIKARGTIHGTTIFRPRDLRPLSELDARGFRRLRPGAEGLLKFVVHGTANHGNPDRARLQRERVAELLREDPVGAEQAARLFGSASGQVLALAGGYLHGEWNRSSMRRLHVRLRLRLLLEPANLLQRLWSRIGPGRECCGIKALIKQGRRVPGDRTGLQHLVQTHPTSPESLSA